MFRAYSPEDSRKSSYPALRTGLVYGRAVGAPEPTMLISGLTASVIWWPETNAIIQSTWAISIQVIRRFRVPYMHYAGALQRKPSRSAFQREPAGIWRYRNCLARVSVPPMRIVSCEFTRVVLRAPRPTTWKMRRNPH